VGNIPLIKFNSSVEKKANNVYFKMEGNNPTGSVKDRTACALILEKIKSRELVKGKTILDASSGSFACSMAYFGKILGFPVITICGSKLTEDKRSFISYFDAE
jgi:cysteine synthase